MATLIMTARPNDITLPTLRAHLRQAAEPSARVVALYADASASTCSARCGVAMHVNKLHAVFAVVRVAKDLAEEDDWRWDVANGMDTEMRRLRLGHG